MATQEAPTKKHKKFVEEPLREKTVDSIPGIGRTAKAELERKGITTAKEVLGYFLIEKNEESFYRWLQQFDANKGNQKACYKALKEFCSTHIWFCF